MLRLTLLIFSLWTGINSSTLFAQASSSFDGKDDKATVYHHSDFNLGTGGFTIEAIVREIPMNRPMLTLISKRDQYNNGFALMVNTVDGITFHAEIGKKKYQINADPLENGGCHSLAIKRFKGQVYMYIDDNGYAVGPNSTNINTSADLVIGDDGAHVHKPFKGIMEEMRFWNKSRLDGEIFDWNDKCISASTNGLLAYWNMEENSGQFFHDVAQVKHHAYLGNSFFSDYKDPSWNPNECLENCCGTNVNFTASTQQPFAGQMVYFSSGLSVPVTYEWTIDNTIVGTASTLQHAFGVGVSIVRLKTTPEDGCSSYFSLAIEVTQQFHCSDESNHIYIPEIPEAESDAKLKVLDRFGSRYNPSEVVPQLSVAPGTCDCANGSGIFELFFEDVNLSRAYGFDDPIKGSARQEVVCKMFRDVSALLNPNGTLAADLVKIQIQESEGQGVSEMSAGALAQASTLYLLGYFNGIVDGLVWKTINSGQNALQGGNAIGWDPNGFHGIMRVNFEDQPNFFLNTPLANETAVIPAGSNQHDLYTVVLHEALHILGFVSLIDAQTSTYQSVLTPLGSGPNLYGRYDLNLKQTGTSNPYINFTAPYSATPNLTLPAIINPTQCHGGVNFDGTNNAGQTLYLPSTWNKSGLSHFNCDPSGSNGCASGNGYVINSCLATEQMQRFPSQAEINTLCDLGYTIANSSGVVTYGETNYGISGANVPFFNAYTSCTPSSCGAIAINDLHPTPVQAGGNLIVPTTSFVTNDLNTTGFNLLSLEVLGGNAIGDISPSSISATGFTFEPNVNFIGTAIIRYAPICAIGDVASYGFIFITVTAPPAPVCNQPINSCNLACNGDFEAYTSNSQLGNFRISYGAGGPFLNPAASWATRLVFAGNTTPLDPNSCFPGTAGTSAGVNLPLPLGNSKCVKIQAGGVNNVWMQSIHLGLESDLVPGIQYEIEYDIATGCDAKVLFAFSENPPIEYVFPTNVYNDLRTGDYGFAQVSSFYSTLSPPWDDYQSDYSSNTNTTILLDPTISPQQHAISNVTGTSPTATNLIWQHKTLTFIAGTSTDVDNLIFHLEPDQNGPSTLTDVAYIDNITITPISVLQATINAMLPPAPCAAQNSIVGIPYEICADASNATSLNTQISTVLPFGVTLAPGGDFTTGQATVNLAPNACTTLVLNVNIPLNASPGTSIDITAALDNNICLQPNTSDATATITINANPPVVTTTCISETSAAATVTGGVGPYTYSWEDINGPIGQNTPIAVGLTPGIYTVIATDNSGCDATASFEIGALDFPIEAEDITSSELTMFTATALGVNSEVYGVGFFDADIEFTSGTTTTTLTKSTSCNSFSPFLIKYDICGLSWAVEIPVCVEMDIMSAPDVALGQNGDVYVSFSFTGTFTINSTTYTAQGVDIVIIKYDQTGTPVWVQVEGGTGDDYAADIETHYNGTNEEVFLIGTLYGSTPNTVIFNTTPSTTLNYTNSAPFLGSNQIDGGVLYIAAYSDNGLSTTTDWVNTIDATATFSGKLAVDISGNVYATGLTNSSFSFISPTGTVGAITTTVNEGAPSATDIDLFVLKYNNAGNEQWAEVYGSNTHDVILGPNFEFDIQCESTTHIGLLLPSGAFENQTGSQAYMLAGGTHLLRLDASNGAISWVKPVAVPTTYGTYTGNKTYNSHLAINGTNYVVSGSFFLIDPSIATFQPVFTSIDFHGTLINYTDMAAHPTFASDGYQGWFVEKFSNTGALQWVNPNTTIVPILTSTIDDFRKLWSQDLDVDNSGQIYSPFQLRGSVTLDLSTTITGGNTTSQSVADGFIAKIDGTTGSYLRPAYDNNSVTASNLSKENINLGNSTISNVVSTASVEHLTTKLYPNPTTGNLTLEILNDAEMNEVERIVIYDVTGQRIQQVFIEDNMQNKFEINLNAQQSGVYFVEMMINKELITKQVILMK